MTILKEKKAEKDPKINQISPCGICKNKFLDVPGCKAFNKIPNEILLGKNKHTKPLKEQKNKIVFERKI